VYSEVLGAENLSLMLAHTRADVHELNTRARTILRQRGKLGTETKVGVVREVMEPDGSITVERGERRFCGRRPCDVLKNDRDLGVKKLHSGNGGGGEPNFNGCAAAGRGAA
jgi:ATP-dependent exoDNAse (exonuclease V) alpha subunit